jgi:hypothetical protein
MLSLFNNWQMEGPGGFKRWTREEGSDKVAYSAEYRVNVDEDSADFRVNVDIADGEVPVAVTVLRGKNDAHPPLALTVGSDGVVTISGMVMNVEMEGKFEVSAPNIVLNGRRIIARDDPI